MLSTNPRQKNWATLLQRFAQAYGVTDRLTPEGLAFEDDRNHSIQIRLHSNESMCLLQGYLNLPALDQPGQGVLVMKSLAQKAFALARVCPETLFVDSVSIKVGFYRCLGEDQLFQEELEKAIQSLLNTLDYYSHYLSQQA